MEWLESINLKTTSTTSSSQRVITLEPNDSQALANLCGPFDEHLRQIEQRLCVQINNRGHTFEIKGEDNNIVEVTTSMLLELYQESLDGVNLTPETIHLSLQQAGLEDLAVTPRPGEDTSIKSIPLIHTKKATIKPCLLYTSPSPRDS